MADIELLPSEYNGQMVEVESISTVTLFRGASSPDALRQRVCDIVILNPWLGGRLVRRNNAVHMTCDASEDCFAVVSSADIQLAFAALITPRRINDMCPLFGDFCVKKGKFCIDKDEALFKVTLVELSDAQFALVVSISHIIADGFTYYSIYAMLSSAPVAMIAERNRVFSDEVHRRSGHTVSFFKSFGVMLNFIIKMMYRPHFTLHSHTIANSSITAIKAQHKSDTSFVSTNDIVTSAYFSAVQASVALMAVNFRNRIPNLTNAYAGNYESCVLYTPSEYASPAAIRSKLTHSIVEGQLDSSPPPLSSFFEQCTTDMAILSNWSTFYHDLQLPNCSHIAHFPIISPNSALLHIGVLFKLNQSTLAMLTLENPHQATPDYQILRENHLLLEEEIAL